MYVWVQVLPADPRIILIFAFIPPDFTENFNNSGKGGLITGCKIRDQLQDEIRFTVI